MLAAVAISLAARGPPPVAVRQDGGTTVLDMQTLGEVWAKAKCTAEFTTPT